MILQQLSQIDSLQTRALASWLEREPDPFPKDFRGLVLQQHYGNFRQWRWEDVCRQPGIDDHALAQAKRAIDKLNGRRHELIEAMDDALLKALHRQGLEQNPRAPLNSESPGSMIDRCSILALRLHFKQAQIDRSPQTGRELKKFEAVHAFISKQRADLLGCLEELMAAVAAGGRRFPVYRHFKIYGGTAAPPPPVDEPSSA